MSARHTMIRASAGSGKTYALTNRFVRLLAEGAAPERIVALTFTRKAAGEFFAEILHKLAAAARDGGAAAKLAEAIERPGLGRADFLRLLRAVVDAMHRLRLGTLDGFFGGIARAFPFELGLTGGFEVLQEHASRVERRRVLRQLFARAADGLDDAQRDFIEAFKRATFGIEEKQLGARLEGFLDEYHETFLAAPDGARWGRAARIWPEGTAWFDAPPAEQTIKALRAMIGRSALSDKQVARWEMFFAALPEWSPGAKLPGPVEYILKNALAVWPDLLAGNAQMVLERRKAPLVGAECEPVIAIVRHIVGGELVRRLEMTRGIHAVLHGYEAVYHGAVRRAGKLTFADVLRILLPDTSGRQLAQGEGGAGRLEIDYRLDAQLDHWLLDEFQDTSFDQWRVLRNLIDEAVQDPSGKRSFFCVGDVKQAIYAWRGGDPALFRDILEQYNGAAPGTIEERHLVDSYRSAPPIIEMVNATFGAADEIAGLFPGPAGDDWNEAWRDHVSARPQLEGQAALLHAADREARFALTLQLLQELSPPGRGLDCAVLTQGNALAAELADYLRREGGLPAVAESDLHVCTDNPLGAALLALVQAAAHPGDTFAQEHWKMTPLRGVLASEGVKTAEQLTHRLLGQIHADGFERTIAYWVKRLEPELAPGDDFSRERARQFVAAAALFDASGGREVADFVAFMERHTVRDAEAEGAIRVMTVHKSKGLGFDVVILPDLEGQRVDQRREGLAVQRAAGDRSVEWVLDLPSKTFYQSDEVLSAHVRAAEATAGYEALSLLYVAMTRAKRAMYVITEPVSPKSDSRNYPRLLAETLGREPAKIRVGRLELMGTWSSGDAEWFVSRAGAVTDAAALAPILAPDAPRPAPAALRRAARHDSLRPSSGRAGVVSAAEAFALEGGWAAALGDEVHRLLAEIEWLAPGEADRAIDHWREERVNDEALAQATRCVAAPALAHVWRRRGQAEVWRERAFEVVLGTTWVTGVFDRVIVEREAGKVVRATVFDFKTDLVRPDFDPAQIAARHAPQLNVYRRVVTVLTGLPADQVRCEAVLTRVGETVEIRALHPDGKVTR